MNVIVFFFYNRFCHLCLLYQSLCFHISFLIWPWGDFCADLRDIQPDYPVFLAGVKDTHTSLKTIGIYYFITVCVGGYIPNIM